MTRDAGLRVGIASALTIAVLIVFAQVSGHGFLDHDDGVYVTENSRVQDGLTLDGFLWAWTAGHATNWHPMTWISHMLDVELFGLDPGGHHLTSVVLHLLNSLLLFALLDRMTGTTWRSAAVAALFAIHPLHVESVAWVAERKDVLSTLFGLGALWAYTGYARKPGAGRYAPVFLLLAAGLTAKPMLVSLPFLLLLLDYWPLARFRRRPWSRLVLEKLPLFGLAALSAAITFAVQRSGGAMGSFEQYPMAVRIPNAVIACATYLRKTIWPADLAVFYPHPGIDFSRWHLALSAGVIVALSITVLRWRRRHPALLCGWLWYLVTLIPVIGLVQVGEQAMADRYTYIPLVGCFVALAWLVPDLRGGGLARSSGIVVAVAAIVALTAAAHVQAGHWRDTETLFRHALRVTRNNHVAHINIGLALSRVGREREAAKQYRQALSVDPRNASAHHNLGLSLVALGKTDEALVHFRKATESDPAHVEAHYNCGTLLAGKQRWDQAVAHLQRAVELEPRYAEARYNLGAALYFRGEPDRAREEIGLARSLGYEPPPEMLELLHDQP